MKTLCTIFLSLFLTNFAFAYGHQEIICSHIPKQDRLYPIGYLNPNKKMHLVIELPIRNKDKRDKLLQSVYDPQSPEYHHYLSPQQFAERFAPTKSDYAQVMNFFRKRGFKVIKSPGRTTLGIDGTVRLIESTFHTRIRLYRHPLRHTDFYAPDKSPWLDLNIPLSGVVGLDNLRKPRPL